MTTSHTFESTARVLQHPAGAIHYHEAGEGPALILIHGSGPGVTGWANFQGNIGVFAEHFRTFIINLPGYGGSAPVAGNPMAISADAVIRFMDALGIDRAHILGNSLGGIVGSIVAAQHPARVDRFVTIGGIGFGLFTAFPGEGINLLTEFAEDPTRERLIQWLRSMVFDQALVTEELIDSRFKQATDPVTMATSRQLYSRAAMKAMSDMTHGPQAAQSFAHLASIQAPTLITWGRDDRVSSLDRAFIALRLIPKAELHVFPNCGHWAMIERKAEFESTVLAFLTRS
jgi:2-hydroxy-6-oxonona-2,4-dienedioate hydrolase